MEQQIDKLTQLGTSAVQDAVVNYTHWFFTSATCWLLFGLLCLVGAWKAWKERDTFEEYSVLAAIILLIVGALTVPLNVPTLLNPRAYAIHQLVTDSTR
jgi:hypothetical protein